MSMKAVDSVHLASMTDLSFAGPGMAGLADLGLVPGFFAVCP